MEIINKVTLINRLPGGEVRVDVMIIVGDITASTAINYFKRSYEISTKYKNWNTAMLKLK